MLTAASVLVCALGLLGRSASTFPPIVLLEVRPPDVSANAEAFVRRNPDTIYLITSAQSFRDAQAGDRTSMKKIASILMHEEWHVLHGDDEKGAYEMQLVTLWSLGAAPGTGMYTSVTRAMQAVLKAQRQRPQPEIRVAGIVP